MLLAPAGVRAQPATGPEIKVGGIFDLTGITSDVGKPFAQGVRDGVQWANENGGINGKRIKLVDVDYGYKIPEAVSAYKRHGERREGHPDQRVGHRRHRGAQGLRGQGQGAVHLGLLLRAPHRPAKFPYNFFAAPSYSDQLRAWLQWVKQDWKDKSRNPKVAFYYGDNAYGKSPIEAGRRFCKEIGVDLVDEEILPGGFQDATSQLLNTKQKGADYAYINVTTTGVSLVLRDAKKLGLPIKFGTNPYGLSEQLPRVAGDVAEGVTGVMPHPPYGANVPGMKRLVDFHAKNHPSDQHDAMYVRGWATFTGVGRGAEARRQGRAAHRRGHQEGARDASRTSTPVASREKLTYTAHRSPRHRPRPPSTR